MSGKTILGILVGFVLLLVVAYYAMPNPGKKALEGEEIAVNNVSSWRIRTEISRDGRLLVSRTHVANCPDKEHIVERGMDNIAEYIRIGDDMYYRKGNMKWVKGTPGPDLFAPFPTPRPCMTNPNEPSTMPAGGAEEMKQWIESDIKEGRISKGEVQEEKGGTCREWTVTRFTPRNQIGTYRVCLGETDSLPRYMKAPGDNFSIYFEWDPSVLIDPPDMNASVAQMPVMP